MTYNADTVNPSGAAIAVDRQGSSPGSDFQRTKVTWGLENVFNEVNEDLPLPVRKSAPKAVPTTVAAATGSTLILSANLKRRGFSITNESAATMYLLCDDTSPAPSVTNYSVKLPPDDYYEDPFNYTGEVRAVWSSATGNARITEYAGA